KNLKNVVQTCGGGFLNGDELSSHIISPCEVDEGYGRRGTACADIRAAHFGEIVFEHDEDFPLVPVWVGNPSLVLDGVTAGGFHLVADVESRPGQLFAHGEDVGGRGDLNPHMR